MIMNNAKANRKIKHILLVLILSLLAVIATSAVSFAEDGHYTVHYETWGLLDDESYADFIQDRTDVYLYEMDLEPNDVPVETFFSEMGYEFEAWYCDEDFSYRYFNDQKYIDAALAVSDPNSPIPDSITLYALVKKRNTDDQYVWGRKDSLPKNNNKRNTFNYFLAYDITMGTDDKNAKAAWSVPNGTAKINLNGHTIKRAESSKDKGTVIYVPQGKTLVIEDRPVNGKKGMITGGIASDVSGGGIYVEGSLIMSSGEVAGNKARSGGGVAVGEGGSATIQQADIAGGGIAVAKDASLSIDGDIYNNKITAGNLGGGIYVDEEAEKLYFGRENSDGNSHIRIQNNIFYEMREPSDLFLNKDALQAGNCRIIMGDIDQADDAGNYVGLTLSPWPELNTDETVTFTSGLGNRRYDFFEPSDSKYEVRTEGEGDAREAVIGTKRHKVTYKVGDETYTQQWVFSGQKAVKPTSDPEQPDGDRFLYWAAEDDQEYDFNASVTADITLHAFYQHIHRLTKTEAEAAKCEVPGNIAYWTCDQGTNPCRKSFSDEAATTEVDTSKNADEGGVILPAPGHDWGGWIVDRPATEDEEGVEIRTCQRSGCDASETRAIPILQHTHHLTKTEAKAAKCEVTGNIAYWTCDQGTHPCRKSFSDEAATTEVDTSKNADEGGVILPAPGHSWDDGKVTKEATPLSEGEKTFTCLECGAVRIEAIPKTAPISIAKASVSGLKAKTWTGKALKQRPVVKLSGKVLKNGTDYTVTYRNNKNVGKAILTITGKRYYTGTIKKTFKINPKGTTLKTLKKGKRSITVKWAKQSKKMSASRVTGYQIQLATNKKFTRNKKTVNVKGYKSVSKKVTKLKAKNKYYVKVRTYKTVGGKKYYSPWSKVTSLSR